MKCLFVLTLLVLVVSVFGTADPQGPRGRRGGRGGPPPDQGGRGGRRPPGPPPPEVIVEVLKKVFDRLSASPNATAINELIASKSPQTIEQLRDLLVELITTYGPPPSQGVQGKSGPRKSRLQGPKSEQSGQGQGQKGGPRRGRGQRVPN